MRKYKLILTNRNMTAYKVPGDQVTLKTELVYNNGSEVNMSGVNIEYYMNYRSFDGSFSNDYDYINTTDIYGVSQTLIDSERYTGISKCNCYSKCVIGGIEYKSNIVRLNFVVYEIDVTIINAGTCGMPDNFDRTNFMTIDRTDIPPSGDTSVFYIFDRML